MCPSWTRVADEIDCLANDRLLAASVEPDERERELLHREAVLLAAAAECADTGPCDGHMVHAACEGVVLHCDRFVMWGIGEDAERELRRLARRAGDVGDTGIGALDPRAVLRVVLGMPGEGASVSRRTGWRAPSAAAVAALLAGVASVLSDAAEFALPFA